MNSSGTCGGDWVVDLPLAPGRRRHLWHQAGLVLGVAVVFGAGLRGLALVAGLLACLLLHRLGRRFELRARRVLVDPEEVVLETDRGRRIHLRRPLRCWRQPGVVTLSLPGLRRLHIFSDECSGEGFRTLCRLLSSAPGR